MSCLVEHSRGMLVEKSGIPEKVVGECSYNSVEAQEQRKARRVLNVSKSSLKFVDSVCVECASNHKLARAPPVCDYRTQW